MEKYGLTFPQKNIYYVEKVSKNLPVNVISGIIKINNGFNEKYCEIAINNVIKYNSAMRIKIKDEENPVEYFEDYQFEEIQIIDMSGCGREKIDEFIELESKKTINIFSDKLYNFKIIRENENTGYILMCIHHIISDAWSCSKIGTKLIEYYEKQKNQEEIQEEVSIGYDTYINNENEYVNSDKYLKDEEFFKEYLKGFGEVISLKDKNFNLMEADRYTVDFEENFNKRVIDYCKENKISVYALFLGALSTYIYRIKDKNDILIGTPTLNRTNFKEKNILGMFVSTLPMRIKINESEKFIDVVKTIYLNNMSLFRHQRYPYSKIVEHIHKNTDIKGKLYNIVLSYQNARAKMDSEIYSTDWKFSGYIQDQLEIHIMDMDDTGILKIRYDYLKDIFSREEIEYLHTRIIAIIENAINDLDVNVEDIRIMSKEEETKILYEFNNTKTDYPKDKTVIELFEEQVKKNPDNVAIVFEGKTMTYARLNEEANRLANYLIKEENIKQNDIVGLILKRSFDIIISILAIHKAGAAYLPIDPDFPIDRIKYMLDNSNTKLVITNIKLENIENVNIVNYKVGFFEKYSSNNILLNRNLNDFAYIIYTSGTTGRPKGVMVLQKNLLHICFSAIQYENLSKMECFGSFSTYSFDISILEIFVPLTLGAKIVFANEDEQKIPDKMGELLNNNNIEVINMTPTRMRLLLEYKDKEAFKSLKRIMLGGEVFPKELFIKLRKYCDADIYDGYGPTEITVWSCAKKIINERSINIGNSLPNVVSYILDKKSRLLPIFIDGELCIGGDGVAYGYYNNEESTNKKFIYFNGMRVYKTGDLCSFDNLGDLNYFGRMDLQIKLNGLRIEIEEIETVAKQFNSVSEVVVNVQENKLCIYFVANMEIDIEEFKNYLNSKLPKYMIPNFYMQIEKFNLTPLGKIDKNNLPKINNTKNREINAPETIIQKRIYSELVKILNTDKIGIDDDFFSIGIDSLSAIELVTKLCSIDLNVTYGNIYDYPNIRALSKYIETKEEIDFDNKEIKNYDYSSINNLISFNNIKNINEQLKTKNINNILLTGVNGFLGIHILENFIKNEKGKIYCVIRRKNNLSAKDRLKEELKFFFGEKYNNYIDDRIIVIDKDIGYIENNDKDELLYEELAKNIDLVIHCAARVKHFGDKEKFENINVNTTKKIADFCMKYKKKLVLISTLSVSGNMLEGGYIEQTNINEKINYKEDNIFVNQKLNNIYAYTKFLAERYVLELATCGLDAIIIRVGNITNRYLDGVFQRNIDENAFANRLKTILSIKTIPENLYDFYLEFSAVDFVADAIIRLSHLNEKFSVIHLFNHNHIKISDFINFLKNDMKIDINIVNQEEFSNLITEYMKDPKKSDDIKGIIIDLNDKNRLNYKTNTTINSDFSIKILDKLGFEWHKVDKEYLKKYFNYLRKLNFLEF